MADKREPDRHTTEFMSLMRAGACNEAFSLIYKPAERASRGALRTLGVDGDDAKEIFHQVLLELFASTWIRFKQECSILTLIYGMAYKRGVDLIVRRSHSAWTPPVSSLPARQADEAADDPHRAHSRPQCPRPRRRALRTGRRRRVARAQAEVVGSSVGASNEGKLR
jgi:DNA-directed RNA polymerase specialized sigma24 family protein